MYSLGQIANVVGGKLNGDSHLMIQNIYTDTRKTIQENSLFVAIATSINNGHYYLENAKKQGAVAVVVSTELNVDIPYILVEDTLVALQELATFHRKNHTLKTIAVTGSNGKTIVKEWIASLMSTTHKVCKSPKSYNSQIGVPLSVWRLREEHTLGVFEAGISKPGEMVKLARIIQPSIGVFTYLGDAHAANFESQEQKLEEKLKLFDSCDVVVLPSNQREALSGLKDKNKKLFTWGSEVSCDLHVMPSLSGAFTLTYESKSYPLKLRHRDVASLENTFNAISAGIVLGENIDSLLERVPGLPLLDMRLQEVAGVSNNQLVVDYYNSDYQSILIALDFLKQQKLKPSTTVILSDILESDLGEIELYTKLNKLLVSSGVSKLIGIGPKLMVNQGLFLESSVFYKNTSDFLQRHPIYQLKNQNILIKGARKFAFEKIAERLKLKTHQTSLEVNLSRLKWNLDHVKQSLGRDTRVMAMVKALGYGSGGYQIAKLLENNKVDYLGVAYTDEATELRHTGITLPIMVLNPDLKDLTPYVEHNIQPVIYSFSSLNSIANERIKIHIEFDTGMHRLGFNPEDVTQLVNELESKPNVEVVSVFSHLAASDDVSMDHFTENQIKKFEKITDLLQAKLKDPFIKHLSNTSGILRHPNAQYDMVRLGIGLYGISAADDKSNLQPVSTFKSYISQIRNVKAGDGIGYGQHSKSDTDRKIAVVAVGYADGYSRAFIQGKGFFMIQGKKAFVTGNVCMDMTMCDVTDIECKEGDEVVIFGDEPRVELLAKNIGTISYEVLSNVSERVSRVYYQE